MNRSESDQITFDGEFLVKLKQRDAIAWTQFLYYFTPILEAKLYYDFRDRGAIEDARNETIRRVMHSIDRDQVRQPERLSPFVRGVCKNVAREIRLKNHRFEPVPENHVESGDPAASVETLLAERELLKLVHADLAKLSENDQKLIQDAIVTARSREEMARELGLTRSGLNVRICRVLKKLRSLVLLDLNSGVK